jgi:hypothetical protein
VRQRAILWGARHSVRAFFDIDSSDLVTAARGFGCEADVAKDSRRLELLFADAGQLERPLVVARSEEALLK